MRVTTLGSAPGSKRATPKGRFASEKSLAAGTGIQVSSEVAASFLVTFDRFEQRFEVAFPEPLGAVPLDDLEEHCRPVGDRLGEDLEQVPVVVAIGENVRALQRLPRQIETGEPFTRLVVVRIGDLHEP